MPDRKLAGMIGLMGVAGVTHFVLPAPYRSIVPRPLAAWRSELVALSGVAELVCAGLLVNPRTRPLGAYATAALLIAVFPANLQMALDGGAPDLPGVLGSGAAAWARLPLQLPLIKWSLDLRRPARRRLPA